MAYRNPQAFSTVKLSKSLSWLLRHGAEKEGFRFSPGGFLYVDEILRHRLFQNFTMEDVQMVVETNDKQRFALEEEAESSRVKIRANQGHTLQVDDLDLEKVDDARAVPMVVHGTTLANWKSIRRQGLRRMRRNHIHFAPGEPGQDGVISGMRQSSEVLIFIDAEKALKDGLQFFRSANNVILCPGNDRGVLLPCYFKEVLEVGSRKRLPLDGGDTSGTSSTEVAKVAKSEEPAEKPRHPIPGLPMTAEELAGEVEKHKKKKKKKKKRKHKETENADEDGEEGGQLGS